MKVQYLHIHNTECILLKLKVRRIFLTLYIAQIAHNLEFHIKGK